MPSIVIVLLFLVLFLLAILVTILGPFMGFAFAIWKQRPDLTAARGGAELGIASAEGRAPSGRPTPHP